MKKAGIVSIGNELLNGQTTDTNASWLAGRLFEMGIPAVGGWAVPDETDRIVRALRAAAELADIIIVRTILEDRTLQNELLGYKDYARKVRFRLIPSIW